MAVSTWLTLALFSPLSQGGVSEQQAGRVPFRVEYRASDRAPWLTYAAARTREKADAIAAEVRETGYQAKVATPGSPSPLPHADGSLYRTSAMNPSVTYENDYNTYQPGSSYGYNWYGGWHPWWRSHWYHGYTWNNGGYWHNGWWRGHGWHDGHRSWNHRYGDRRSHFAHHERAHDAQHHQWNHHHNAAGHHFAGHHGAARHGTRHAGSHPGTHHAAHGRGVAGHHGAHPAGGHAARGHAGGGHHTSPGRHAGGHHGTHHDP